MPATITPIRMPKWGLAMQEGTVVAWSKQAGDDVREGEDLVDVETSKITNVYESPASGRLRRIVAQVGETLPVGGLLAVLADASVDDAEIDAFVTDFQANFTPSDADDGGGGLATREVDAGGVRLRVAFAGQDKPDVPAVLVHGFGGDLENWTLLMGPLAEDRPVYALDLPGHGQSEKTLHGARVGDLADAVIAAVAALGLTRVHLVGHSLGGAVALATALRAPGLVESLTLVAAVGVPGATVNTAYLDGFIDAQRARDLTAVAALLFADASLVTKDLVEGLLRYKRLDGVDDALRAIRDALVETEDVARLAASAGEVKAPTLVIVAERDAVVSAPDRAALPAQFKVEVVSGSGHLPQIEKAEQTAALVRAHLRA
ncbi:MAG: acetoin dehydrogenase dihydrolipoyllysine-residue acetyltransferase subunit [Alphaproteobacteria bacterium]|nr:acetoin dehydrogenase dihydrolipoyllysine-residue acetyltransferase subunit [Alphaproteobacteria bacterium]